MRSQPTPSAGRLTVGIQRKRVNWVLDADIRGFFDNLSRAWTMKFIEHRVVDRHSSYLEAQRKLPRALPFLKPGRAC
jgi:hypothetical protein